MAVPTALRAPRLIVWANLSLLVLLPVAWVAPLLRAGLLPLFGLSEISVLSGILSLYDTDVALAALVGVLALLAPWLKTLGLALIHFGRLPGRLLPVLQVLGKVAMADVFLVALYVVLAKGTGVGRVETAWGLYLFTGCILTSLLISHLTPQHRQGHSKNPCDYGLEGGSRFCGESFALRRE